MGLKLKTPNKIIRCPISAITLWGLQFSSTRARSHNVSTLSYLEIKSKFEMKDDPRSIALLINPSKIIKKTDPKLKYRPLNLRQFTTSTTL